MGNTHPLTTFPFADILPRRV